MPLPKVIVLTVPEDSSYKASRLLECFKDGVNDCLDGMGSGNLYEDAAQMADSARLIDLEAEKQVRPKGLDRMDMGEADLSALQAYNAALRMIAGEK